MFGQGVGEVGRVDARNGDDARERDADETETDRGAAGDVAAEQRVEESDPHRRDEDRKSPAEQGSWRDAGERNDRDLCNEDERRRDQVDREEEREHEDERRRDLRERVRARERCPRIRCEGLEEPHAARPPAR